MAYSSLMEEMLTVMKTFDEIKQQLLQIKPQLQQVYRVTELGNLGSYARQEQTEASGGDVLIDYDQAPTLFKLVELREDLNKGLEMKVDVVTKF